LSLALGIDTGGTYTDVALVEYDSGRVLAVAKALTTKHNLSLGISQAIDNVAFDPREIGLVSLSTTLATNALVEAQGAPVCSILIGYEGRVAPGTDLSAALNTPFYALVSGGHDSSGRELTPLDSDAVRHAACAYADQAEAFAISSYFGTRNAAHELAARDLVQRLTNKPVTCGHELSSKLDALRRATTASLNASLIPLVCGLLDAVLAVLAERRIEAPVMVVKGDGSLISAEVARERPVETILSGPAASVVGAMALTGNNDTIVVDMGGTTTDIAIIRDGAPVLSSEGATVGGWRTMVEAIDVYTCGLGGDSQVHLDERGALQVGPNRALPLAVLAASHPAIISEMERQLRRPRQPGDGEFVVLQRSSWPSNGQASDFELRLRDALESEPVSVERLREITSHPGLYDRQLSRLFRQGLIIRAALTPTDCAHVLGWYREWDAHASEVAAELLARRWGLECEALCHRALTRTVQQSAYHVIRAVLASEGPPSNGTGPDDDLLARALGSEGNSLLSVAVRLNRPLVALGAPSPTYWPHAAGILSADLSVPEYAHVANAVGAVAGSVVTRLKAQVAPSEDSASVVAFVPGEWREFGAVDEAIAFATAHCSELAKATALASGATEVRVNTTRLDHTAPVGLGAEEETWLYTELATTAAGRPALGHG